MPLKCYVDNVEKYNIDSYIMLSKKDHFVNALIYDRNKYDFSVDLNDKKYKKEDIFTSRVNIDQVGILYFYIDSGTLDRTVFDEIKKLKDININSNEDAINKINKLIDIMDKHGYLFAIFSQYKTSYDVKDNLIELFNNKYLIIIDEPSLSFIDINNSYIGLLKHYKYRWILLFLGGVIMIASGMYGVSNALVNNITIFIVMLITCLAGLVAVAITHLDYWDDKPVIKSKVSLLMLIFDIVPILLGYLGFFGLFQTLPENELSFVNIALLSLPAILLIYVTIVFLTRFIKNKHNEQH